MSSRKAVHAVGLRVEASSGASRHRGIREGVVTNARLWEDGECLCTVASESKRTAAPPVQMVVEDLRALTKD